MSLTIQQYEKKTDSQGGLQTPAPCKKRTSCRPANQVFRQTADTFIKGGHKSNHQPRKERHDPPTSHPSPDAEPFLLQNGSFLADDADPRILRHLRPDQHPGSLTRSPCRRPGLPPSWLPTAAGASLPPALLAPAYPPRDNPAPPVETTQNGKDILLAFFPVIGL